MSGIVAVQSKKGENTAEKALTMLKALKLKNLQAYGIVSHRKAKMISLKESKHLDVNSPTIIGYAISKAEQDRIQSWKLAGASLVFDGKMYLASAENAESAIAVRRLQHDHAAGARMLANQTKGDFVFVLAESERIIAGRDVMGVQPLYYGENKDLAALASERKALWRIGIGKTCSFPPGHVALINKHGFRFSSARKLAFSKPKRMTMQTATRKLQSLLKKSTKERVYGLDDVAVAFSGGLDSSIIAFLAKNSGVGVHLIHVSLENQPETGYARQAAEELRLPINCHTYTTTDVKRIVPSILELIEEPDPGKVSIGIPIYWAAEETAEMNLRVMLTGQGADETFGGYKRYVHRYSQHGSEEVRKTIFNDIAAMYRTNLERDSKISNFHNVELRLPFASYPIAEFATVLPTELMIEASENTLRKLVLRQAAEGLGLPESIVNRPKKAVQYATGVDKALKGIAQKRGLSVREYVQETFHTVFKEVIPHE